MSKSLQIQAAGALGLREAGDHTGQQARSECTFFWGAHLSFFLGELILTSLLESSSRSASHHVDSYSNSLYTITDIIMADSEGDAASTNPKSYTANARSGDVLFNLNDGSNIRAPSIILMNASTVFQPMLISRFREGLTPRSTEKPVCIPLPEDPPAAMLDLCSILHIRTLPDWDQEEQESVIRFLDLAIAADKYICQEAVTLATEGLLSRYALTVNGHHQNILSLAVSSFCGVILV